LDEDRYLTKLGTLLIRAVPMDEALEALLTERTGGDAQIQRVRSLHDQLVVLQKELEGLTAIEQFAGLQIICQKIFRHNVEGCRLLELAIVSSVQTLFSKAGAELALAENAQREAFTWIDGWEMVAAPLRTPSIRREIEGDRHDCSQIC
jgi:hypothetical protein